MRREAAHHTLQATALVHEAFMVLVRQDSASFNDRAHFFAVASRMMRRILVDHARGRMREKRGGEDAVKVQLEDDVALSPQRDEDVLALEHALQELEKLDPRQASIVVMRFFGGCTVDEVAQALSVSKRTVEADWTMAKAWLRRALSET